MSNIKLFQNQEIRSHWDAEQEQWFFSVIDVVGALSGSVNPRKYWSVLKTRLKKEVFSAWGSGEKIRPRKVANAPPRAFSSANHGR